MQLRSQHGQETRTASAMIDVKRNRPTPVATIEPGGAPDSPTLSAPVPVVKLAGLVEPFAATFPDEWPTQRPRSGPHKLALPSVVLRILHASREFSQSISVSRVKCGSSGRDGSPANWSESGPRGSHSEVSWSCAGSARAAGVSELQVYFEAPQFPLSVTTCEPRSITHRAVPDMELPLIVPVR
jgi:hypothetical protein